MLCFFSFVSWNRPIQNDSFHHQFGVRLPKKWRPETIFYVFIFYITVVSFEQRILRNNIYLRQPEAHPRHCVDAKSGLLLFFFFFRGVSRKILLFRGAGFSLSFMILYRGPDWWWPFTGQIGPSEGRGWIYYAVRCVVFFSAELSLFPVMYEGACKDLVPSGGHISWPSHPGNMIPQRHSER